MTGFQGKLLLTFSRTVLYCQIMDTLNYLENKLFLKGVRLNSHSHKVKNYLF